MNSIITHIRHALSDMNYASRRSYELRAYETPGPRRDQPRRDPRDLAKV